jgi:hypothetical protein
MLSLTVSATITELESDVYHLKQLNPVICGQMSYTMIDTSVQLKLTELLRQDDDVQCRIRTDFACLTLMNQ